MKRLRKKLYNDNLCLFRALALRSHGNGRLEEETTKLFTLLLEKNGGHNPTSFQGVCTKDIPAVEDLDQVNIFLYDIDFVDGAMIGELDRRTVDKHYYVTTVTFVMSLISMYSSKLIAAHRVILSSTEHQFWSVI